MTKCECAGCVAWDKQQQESNAAVAEPPAFTGPVDELSQWIASADRAALLESLRAVLKLVDRRAYMTPEQQESLWRAEQVAR